MAVARPVWNCRLAAFSTALALIALRWLAVLDRAAAEEASCFEAVTRADAFLLLVIGTSPCASHRVPLTVRVAGAVVNLS